MYQEDWKQGWQGLPIAFVMCALFFLAFWAYDYAKAHPGACHDPVDIIQQDEYHYACPGRSHTIIIGDHLACKCNEGNDAL